MKVILMNKNTEVATVEYNSEHNFIETIYEIKNLSFGPLRFANATVDKRLRELNDWFTNRGIPAYRDNASEILNSFGINSLKELANKDYALSLSDQYWLKPYNSDVRWADVNYFKKDYDSVTFVDATYGSDAHKSVSPSGSRIFDGTRTPNNMLNGQLRKVWIKRGNRNLLLKGSGMARAFEPINEVLASEICKILDLPCAEYSLEVIHSKRSDNLVSVCECFINDNEEIVPAYAIIFEKQELFKHNPSDYYTYLDILKEHNVPNCEEYLQKMFLLDYIILNEDRHTNNFGVIRDVNTLEWTRMCPVFDTGRSMNTMVTSRYWNFAESEVKCFTSDLISCKVLEQFFSIKISTQQIEAIRNLGTVYSDMIDQYRQYTNLTEVEATKLKAGFYQRINELERVLTVKGLIFDEPKPSVRMKLESMQIK